MKRRSIRLGAVGCQVIIDRRVGFHGAQIQIEAAVGNIPLAHIVYSAVEEYLILGGCGKVPEPYLMRVILVIIDNERIFTRREQSIVFIKMSISVQIIRAGILPANRAVSRFYIRPVECV